MPRLATAALTSQRETYLGYSIGCAAVWSAILAAARHRLDPRSFRTLGMCCGAWWSGWASATIARVGYPPAKPLTPAGQQRLARASLALVALGLIGAIRVLMTGKLARS